MEHMKWDSVGKKKVTFKSNHKQACIMKMFSLSLLGFDLCPGTLAYSTQDSSRLILMVLSSNETHTHWVKSRVHWIYLADHWIALNSSWWTYISSEASTINSCHNARTHKQRLSFANPLVSPSMFSVWMWLVMQTMQILTDTDSVSLNSPSEVRTVLSGIVNELWKITIISCEGHNSVVLCEV